MGFFCCLWSTPGVVSIFVSIFVVVLHFFRKTKSKLDLRTKKLLTIINTVPDQCKPCISALLDAQITSDENVCAEQMRNLIQSGCLPYNSLATNPELLLSMSTNCGDAQTNGALWTRFTVQYNLFAGSIVALGSTAQRDALYRTQTTGDLGCFAFTEAGAGVLSGAAFESTAVFDRSSQTFTINCPTPSSQKRWISQGQFAEHAVIAANLMVTKDGQVDSLGPHLFFTRIQVLLNA